MGCSVISGITWARTAPNPYEEASAATLIGNLGSKCTRTEADVRQDLAALKACSQSEDHIHLMSLESNLLRGYKREERLEMKFL